MDWLSEIEIEYEVFAALMEIKHVKNFVVNARWTLRESVLSTIPEWENRPFQLNIMAKYEAPLDIPTSTY